MVALVMSMQVMFANVGVEPHVDSPSPVSDVKEGYMISGHVIEKDTEENIPYASVLIVGTDKGTMSNEAGQFQFKGLTEGTYVLRVSAVGYKTMEKTITVGGEYMAVVHFPLAEENFIVDEVVVSASRSEVSRRDAPVVVSVLSPILFETVNSTDLAKSLNFP
jgi:outer membrane receptor for ferrienterochelin and colicins